MTSHSTRQDILYWIQTMPVVEGWDDVNTNITCCALAILSSAYQCMDCLWFLVCQCMNCDAVGTLSKPHVVLLSRRGANAQLRLEEAQSPLHPGVSGGNAALRWHEWSAQGSHTLPGYCFQATWNSPNTEVRERVQETSRLSWCPLSMVHLLHATVCHL